MKQSLSYYIVLLVLKLKGIKKVFSRVPIDFKKLRREDVHFPKDVFFKNHVLQIFKLSDSLITEIGLYKDTNKLLIFVHGGAFISGPAQHHWNAIKKIATETNYKIWMCDYPKAPEHNIAQINENIDAIYKTALENFSPDQISCIGDSAGGTLVTSLIQRLIKKNINLPNKVILVSPVMDASMTNPEIEKVDLIDPMLSKAGVVSAKKMCVGSDNLKNEMISPLYGSFEKFPQSVLFLAENDITYPDQKLLVRRLIDVNNNPKVIIGKNMPHIWPFLPVMKESKDALKEIIGILNN